MSRGWAQGTWAPPLEIEKQKKKAFLHIPGHAPDTYSRKVWTGTWSQTQGLLFNVRALYQLSYPDRIQFCYVNSGFISNYPSVASYVRGARLVHVHVYSLLHTPCKKCIIHKSAKLLNLISNIIAGKQQKRSRNAAETQQKI